MTISLFIDGAEGTTGLEIRERLAGRRDIVLIALEEGRRKDEGARREAINDAEIVILCLPDEAAREACALIDNTRTRVIDASSAHRVAEGWVYGMAELEPGQEDAIAAAPRVSNPGCYPTGFLALVRPLIRAGIIPADWPLTINAVSGYSGGGKAMIAEFEGRGATPSYRCYGLGLAHKHGPEMHRHSRLVSPPLFAPAVVNTYRGMIVEVPLPLHALPRKPTIETCDAVLREAYRDDGLIAVLPQDGDTIVAIEELAGSDRLNIRVRGNAETDQARLIATLDNLGKGAAGAAVQNLNIMAGLDPLTGLNI